MNDYYYFMINPVYNDDDDPVYWDQTKAASRLKKRIVYKTRAGHVVGFNRNHPEVLLMLSPVEALVKSRGKGMKECL